MNSIAVKNCSLLPCQRKQFNPIKWPAYPISTVAPPSPFHHPFIILTGEPCMVSQSCIRPPVCRSPCNDRRTAYLCRRRVSTCGFSRRPRPWPALDGTSNPAGRTGDCSLRIARTAWPFRFPGRRTGAGIPKRTRWPCSRKAYTGKC